MKPILGRKSKNNTRLGTRAGAVTKKVGSGAGKGRTGTRENPSES